MDKLVPRVLSLLRECRERTLGTRLVDGAFSHDVTAAILVFQNKERAAMLVYQTKPLGIELHFHANFSFFCMKLTWPLVT